MKQREEGRRGKEMEAGEGGSRTRDASVFNPTAKLLINARDRSIFTLSLINVDIDIILMFQ